MSGKEVSQIRHTKLKYWRSQRNGERKPSWLKLAGVTPWKKNKPGVFQCTHTVEVTPKSLEVKIQDRTSATIQQTGNESVSCRLPCSSPHKPYLSSPGIWRALSASVFMCCCKQRAWQLVYMHVCHQQCGLVWCYSRDMWSSVYEGERERDNVLPVDVIREMIISSASVCGVWLGADDDGDDDNNSVALLWWR